MLACCVLCVVCAFCVALKCRASTISLLEQPQEANGVACSDAVEYYCPSSLHRFVLCLSVAAPHRVCLCVWMRTLESSLSPNNAVCVLCGLRRGVCGLGKE